MKKGFLNYLTYVNRKGLKVMHTNTDITFWRKERTARMFAMVASNTETLESRWNEAEIEAGSFWLKTCEAAWTAASGHKQSLQLIPNHLHEEHPVGDTQKDLFAKTIDFFFNMWDKGVGVFFCFFFSLYKELCVWAGMCEYVIVIFSRYGCLVIMSQSMPERALQDYFWRNFILLDLTLHSV